MPIPTSEIAQHPGFDGQIETVIRFDQKFSTTAREASVAGRVKREWVREHVVPRVVAHYKSLLPDSDA